MAMKFAALERIENGCRIERDTNPEFWHHLEQGLLLALTESGTLHAAHSLQAREELDRDRREWGSKPERVES